MGNATEELSLWIDGNAGWFQHFRDLTRDVMKEYAEKTDEELIGLVADVVEAHAGPMFDPREYVDCYGDLPLGQWLNTENAKAFLCVGRLAWVDWRQLARTYISDVREGY